MRRIVTVVVVTIGGLALIASFHTVPGTASKSVVVTSPTTQPPAGGSPPSPPTSPSGTSPADSSTPSSGGAGSQTIDGPVVSNRYGDVQVEVVISGGRISDVVALQLPSDRRRSEEISSIAGPYLRQEALQAQSANIDIVSGATYTSVSYAQSLQAALDQIRG